MTSQQREYGSTNGPSKTEAAKRSCAQREKPSKLLFLEAPCCDQLDAVIFSYRCLFLNHTAVATPKIQELLATNILPASTGAVLQTSTRCALHHNHEMNKSFLKLCSTHHGFSQHVRCRQADTTPPHQPTLTTWKLIYLCPHLRLRQ